MLLNLRRTAGPLHRQIYDALKSAIRGGRLAAGARLPSTRTLAVDLNVSRNTVSLAYEQLAAEGYVVARHRSAMLVSSGAPGRPAPPSIRPVPKPEPRLSAYGQRLAGVPNMPPSGSYASRHLRYDFRYGRPAFDDFPRETWRQMVAARMRRTVPESFGYAPPAGYAPLREALAEYLARARGMSCNAGQIIIVNGSQQAFDLVARVLLDPGDRVVVEEPGYHGSRLTFHAAGADLVAVPVDREGLDTTRLPPVTARVRMACVTPCHQFPTGVIMPLSRRLALMDWATRSGAWIVEDDYVSEFRYEGRPIEALQALDHSGRVIYIGTFSKILYPALRLAYVVVPPALVAPILSAKWIADRYSTMLGQEALTDFIASGRFERYLRRACKSNAARRRALIGAFEDNLGDRVEIAGENAGVHLLVWLKDIEPRDVDAIIAKAARAGVGIYPIDLYYSRPPRRAGLLFGYAALTEAEIRRGIRRLAEIL